MGTRLWIKRPRVPPYEMSLQVGEAGPVEADGTAAVVADGLPLAQRPEVLPDSGETDRRRPTCNSGAPAVRRAHQTRNTCVCWDGRVKVAVISRPPTEVAGRDGFLALPVTIGSPLLLLLIGVWGEPTERSRYASASSPPPLHS